MIIFRLKKYLRHSLKHYLKPLLILLACTLLIAGCSEEVNKKRQPLKFLADENGQFANPSIANKIIFPQAHAPKKAYR